MRVLDFLRSFRVNLLAIGVGVLIGLFSKQMGESLKIAGQLYLALLTMTVLPIVFSAITHGVGRLLRSGRFGRNLGYLVVIFVGRVLLGSMLGILVGTVGKAGVDLKAEDSKALGTLLLQDQSPRIHGNPSSAGLSQLLGDVIPHNVFAAFVGGKGLAVVFISILMGISLGTNRSQASDRLLETIRGIYETFFKIMGWVLYGLPFGLCCLTAEHVATVGTTILVVLLKLIVLLYAGCGVLWLIYLFIMRFVTGKSFRTLLLSLKGGLVLSYVASNSMVAMPIAMKGLEDDLDQPQDVVEMVVPLSIAMNRHAYPLLFALVVVYTSQTYGHALGVSGVIQVWIASALVGMAAVGQAAAVAPLAAMIISSVGLPTQLGIIAMVESTAVVTPVVAMTHLFGSCATATIVSRLQSRQGQG